MQKPFTLLAGCLLLMLLSFSNPSHAQNLCDSTITENKVINCTYSYADTSNLTILYRTAHLCVLAPLDLIVSQAKGMGLTDAETLEMLCNPAKKAAWRNQNLICWELLMEGKCLILMKGQPLKSYRKLEYIRKDCRKGVRFAFKDELFLESPVIY